MKSQLKIVVQVIRCTPGLKPQKSIRPRPYRVSSAAAGSVVTRSVSSRSTSPDGLRCRGAIRAQVVRELPSITTTSQGAPSAIALTYGEVSAPSHQPSSHGTCRISPFAGWGSCAYQAASCSTLMISFTRPGRANQVVDEPAPYSKTRRSEVSTESSQRTTG
ncbi:hypothetical protein JNW88_28560 [Micromonospora sp. ATA32]|nr:hypothetical protein [Micromonospora sp. ATA32]